MCLQDILESCVLHLNSPNPQRKGGYYIIAIQIRRISSVYSKWMITICHTVCHWTFPSMHIFLLLTLVRSAHRLACLLLALLTTSCPLPSFLRELSIQLCHRIPRTASALSLLRLINGRKEKTEVLSFGELNCQLYCIAGEQTPWMGSSLLFLSHMKQVYPMGCGPVLCTAKTNAIRLHSHVSLPQTN